VLVEPARTRLRLLRGFSLTCAGAAVDLPASAQRVLAFVALHDGSVRRYIAGSLWLDSSEERAQASLRSALWRLRSCGLELVDVSGQGLRLASDLAFDVRELEAKARLAQSGSAGALDLTSAAFDGHLLPDWYEDWLVLERERCRQLSLHALDALCDRLTDAGRFSDALDAGLASIAGEPLRESAHRAVVRLHLAEGNVCEARRQYRLCADLLRDQLDVAPSGQMEALVRQPARRVEPPVRLVG
jgi:DNA-binding SARP family transcriptional activator